MKYLIIYYSPIPESFTVQLAEIIQQLLEEKNQTVVMRNLEQLKFNPVTSFNDIEFSKIRKYTDDVACEQEYVSNADHLIFVYPLYQLSMPAVMKGYIDRVLTQNFAYSYNANGSINPLMQGKKVSIFCPMGALYDLSVKNGDIAAMNHIFSKTFEIRGFEIKNISYFDFSQRKLQISTLKELFN